MASTEEVLKALQNAKITTLAATEPEELVIDAESRTITVPSSERLFGVTGDMNIERKYFRCPKIVGDNVDLSTHQIFIAYVYTETESGSIFPSIGVAPYHCEDVEVDGEDITFSWKLTGNVFKNPGFILFKMYAKKTETDPNTVFNTTPAIGTVLATIPDGTEEIKEEYPDVIAQIFDRLDALESGGGGGTGGTTNYEKLSNKPKLNGVTLEGNKTLDQVGVLAKNQGASNSGKYLSVGSDGNVVPADAPSGGTVDPEQIKQAVNGYLEENPIEGGMTEEQEKQLNQNTSDVFDLKSAINEKIDKTGWNPDKFIGTDNSGNIVEKEEPTGGSEYFEVLNNVSSGTLTVGIPPTSWNTDNDDWKSVRYGSILHNFMSGSNAKIVNKKVLIPSGTIYVRMAISNIYSPNIGSYSIFAVNSPILPEEYSEEMEVTGEKVAEESVTTDFNIDGETNKWYIDSDGAIFKYNDTSEANKSIPEYTGGIILKKYVIPEGKYGWLYAPSILGNAVSSNMHWNPAGYPAIFTTDPTDNITQSVNSGEEGESGGQLKPKDEYVEGFMKFIAGNADFQSYLREYISDFIPLTSKRQTFGKAIYIGGDSLHAYAGGDGFSTSGFVTNWNKYLGFARVTNAGYAGSKWSETTGGGGIKKAKDLISAGTVYDVIILAWGTNDDTGGNGTIDDVASDAEGATMVAAMKWIITNLRNTFKSTAIGVIIPPPKGTEDGMKTRGDLMIQVCELLHVPYVDMREYISISDLGSDHIHLGTGAGKYGAAEASLILRICHYGDTLYPGTTD